MQASCSMRCVLLHVQMEFCEKSTLRDCIDAGLCRDPGRVWQLFREIVEGLVHIHEQVSRFSCVINTHSVN